MKYEIIKACLIKGVSYRLSDVVALDDQIAKELMAMGRVAPYAEPEKVEDRSVGLSVDKPKPKRRAKVKK